MSPGLDFKALTPGGFWEADSVETIVDEVLLGSWFDPSVEIEELESVETSKVADRNRVAYRLRVSNPDGLFLVEQQAYYRTPMGSGSTGFESSAPAASLQGDTGARHG